jgi:predicted nucleic acid-binding Zn ribbon protein
MPERRPEAARALVAGSERECPGCGNPLAGQQKACSGKCRAKLSRQRKADELRALIAAGRQVLDALEQRLGDPT